MFVKRILSCFFVSLDSKFGFVLVAFAWEDWFGPYRNKANIKFWEEIENTMKIDIILVSAYCDCEN